MIFTGKPGSCKTTVARLLAKTLKEEGVLETGEFVECGRADLTARYVGWTDKTVRAKFRQANGGILFIDEAYSLVEEDGYYGDEAINTIVQEMENHREDVIVIFAGYPDKMQRFLEKNEGLRSRIAFHVSFPDYNADELMRIFAKMLEDRGMKTTGAAKEKVLGYCKMVVTQENFGNGRFVRNLIEQAVMKQSSRLFDRYKGRVIPKDRLLMLETEDFEIENMIPSKQRTRKIGFCA
jgi:SpoVK/Ycf46/Vps4 family AAA+-type ATPase